MKLPESLYKSSNNIGNYSKLRLLCIVVRLTGDGVCVCVCVCFDLLLWRSGVWKFDKNFFKKHASDTDMGQTLKTHKKFPLTSLKLLLGFTVLLYLGHSLLSFSPLLGLQPQKQAHWLMKSLNWENHHQAMFPHSMVFSLYIY